MNTIAPDPAVLRDPLEDFSLAVFAASDGLWDWDMRRGVVTFSPRWKATLGYEDAEIGNDFDEWESRVHPDDQERTRLTLERYLAGETAEYELEHRLRHKDGSYRWVLARGMALRDETGR